MVTRYTKEEFLNLIEDDKWMYNEIELVAVKLRVIGNLFGNFYDEEQYSLEDMVQDGVMLG